MASVLSNGIYLLVFVNLSNHLDIWQIMVAYVLGATIGSMSMHYVSMKYLEKWFKAKQQ